MKSHIKNIRSALAELKKGRDGWLWVVPVCPLCGRQHIHGGGSLACDPYDYLGRRVAHCFDRVNGAGRLAGYTLKPIMQG